jgi:hypothetical protein
MSNAVSFIMCLAGAISMVLMLRAKDCSRTDRVVGWVMLPLCAIGAVLNALCLVGVIR